MPKCCVKGCGSKYSRHRPNISLHRFPKNESLKRKWLDFTGQENFNSEVKGPFVCSLHFEDTCFNRTLDIVRLRENSVPTCFALADEDNTITSTHDSTEEGPFNEEEENDEMLSDEDFLSKRKVGDENKRIIEKGVSTNFTDIEKDILNTTTSLNEPDEVKVCCVKGCRSQSDKDNAKISYHSFPPPGANTVYLLDTSTEQRELDQREAWRQLLRLDEPPTDDMLVCSIHFKYQDFIDPETDIPSERALHPQAVPIRCPPFYEGIRESILNEIRKERKLLAQAKPATDEESCALRVQQLTSEWSDGEDSRTETHADEGFTQEEWLNEDEWISEAELDDEKNADMQEEPLEEEYLSDMDSWDDLPNHLPEATVNGDVTHREAEREEEEEEGELDRDEDEDMQLYDFGSSASMSSTEDILEKFSIDLRAERPTTFLPLLGDAATRILTDELASVKRLVKETRARVREARALKNQQADEIAYLWRKIREIDRDQRSDYNLEGSL